MRQAVTYTHALTPFGPAFWGSLNKFSAKTLATTAVSLATGWASLAPDKIEDLVMSGVLTSGTAVRGVDVNTRQWSQSCGLADQIRPYL